MLAHNRAYRVRVSYLPTSSQSLAGKVCQSGCQLCMWVHQITCANAGVQHFDYWICMISVLCQRGSKCHVSFFTLFNEYLVHLTRSNSLAILVGTNDAGWIKSWMITRPVPFKFIPKSAWSGGRLFSLVNGHTAVLTCGDTDLLNLFHTYASHAENHLTLPNLSARNGGYAVCCLRCNDWKIVEGEFAGVMLVIMPCRSDKSAAGVAKWVCGCWALPGNSLRYYRKWHLWLLTEKSTVDDHSSDTLQTWAPLWWGHSSGPCAAV